MKLKPGKVTPSADLVTFTFTTGASGRSDFGGPKHRILREHFAIYLGDEMILARCILAPDLSELNALYGHRFFPFFSDYSPRRQTVNCSRVTLVGCRGAASPRLCYHEAPPRRKPMPRGNVPR